jgi:hypothetical protein
MDRDDYNRILSLETALLSSDIRKSTEKLSQIVGETFFEFGSSGKTYRYSSGDTFPPIAGSINIENFTVIFPGENIALATYNAVKKVDSGIEISSRSSLWKRYGEDWKIIFHQGTKHPS